MGNTEKLVEDILEDRVTIGDLDLAQMQAVIDFMREHISELAESAETEDDEAYADGLLILVDLIEDAAARRFKADPDSNWDQIVQDSIERGNTYFELEQYTLQ